VSILLLVVFISTFIILITLNIDYRSISSIDIKDKSFNAVFQRDEITDSFIDQDNIQTMLTKSNSNLDDSEVIETSSSPVDVFEKLINNIINIQTSHTSGDTIKRSLIAQVNNAILILKDDDSDNDDIICNSFVNKFLSSVKLYERIGLFKPNSSENISNDILSIKNSLCSTIKK
jgi:hypothetical protein